MLVLRYAGRDGDALSAASRALRDAFRAAAPLVTCLQICVFGGYANGVLSAVEWYDTIQNSWSLADSSEELPVELYALAAAEVDGPLYFV